MKSTRVLALLLASTFATAFAQTVTLQNRSAIPATSAPQLNIDPCAQFQSAPLLVPRAASSPTLQRLQVAGGPPSGNGPLLDVFSFSPTARAPKGGELVLVGRNFPTEGVAARIGSTALELLSATTGEARFQIPANLQVERQPLVVWQAGGTPRTLTAEYTVFDPTVRILGVVPASFAKGEQVRLCGRGLSNTWQATPTNGVRTTQMLRIGDFYVEMHSPELSANGNELTFIAGGPKLFARLRVAQPGSSSANYDFVTPANSPPAVTGRIGLTQRTTQISSSEIHNTDVYSPGEVQWNDTAPLRLTEAFSSGALGKAPFALLDPAEFISRQVSVLGTGLDTARVTLGGVPMASANNAGLGNRITFHLPTDAASGELCAQTAATRRCLPGVFRVMRSPQFVGTPGPAADGAEQTISGIALTSDPMVPAVTYDLMLSEPPQCPLGLEVLEHTDVRIRFRVTYRGGAPLRAQCGGTTQTAGLLLRGSFGEVTRRTLARADVRIVIPR